MSRLNYRFPDYGEKLALSLVLFIILSDEMKEILTIKETKERLKQSKFHKNGNLDFLTTCHETIFDKLSSTSILAIVHFISKLLLLFNLLHRIF